MARRTPPKLDPSELIGKIEATESQWQTYKCKLVTPMYGGGVEPGVVDKEMPIRASAIRGQLRFWWRIACAQGLRSVSWPMPVTTGSAEPQREAVAQYAELYLQYRRLYPALKDIFPDL